MLATVIAHLGRCCLVFTFERLIEGIAPEARLTLKLSPLVFITDHFAEFVVFVFCLLARCNSLEERRSLLTIVH